MGKRGWTPRSHGATWVWMVCSLVSGALSACGTPESDGGAALVAHCVWDADCPTGQQCGAGGLCQAKADSGSLWDGGGDPVRVDPDTHASPDVPDTAVAPAADAGAGQSDTGPGDAGAQADAGCAQDEECDDADPCTADQCVGGACAHSVVETCCQDAASCDDGLACTVDSCTAGVCGHTLDGQHCLIDGACVSKGSPGDASCTACLPDVDEKAYSPNPGGSCDDNDSCTANDVCGPLGGCAGTPKPDCCKQDADCTPPSACHLVTCDLQSQQCQSLPKPGCCLDDLACAGAGTACAMSFCNPVGHVCDSKPAQDGLQCDDGNPCSEMDACKAGSCAGSAKVCDDSDPCTSDSCVGGACSSQPIAGCCSSGQCCDVQAGKVKAQGEKCGDKPMKAESKCVGNEVHKREAWDGCSGASTACSALPQDQHWTAWSLAQTCPANTKCVEEGSVVVCKSIVVAQPDLLSTLFSSSKTSYVVGETAMLSSTVKNGGTGAAGAFAVEYRLSTNTAITSSDTLLSTVNKTGLSAGASTSASVSVKLPTVAPGTYYLGVRIDPTAKVAESNESNNIATYKITIASAPAGKPDLLSTLFSSSKTSYVVGETAMLSSTVKNGGTGAAGAFAVEYRLSTNTTITSSDTLLSTVNKTGLSAGASTSASVSVKLPTVAPGTYYLGVRIDPTAKVAESNESNNTATYKITIASAPAGKPDLLSTLFSSSKTSYVVGETAMLSSTVKNGGTGAAGAFAVEYRLSTNTTITSSDTLLSTVNKTGLSAGASTSASVSVKLPTVAPGTYYLGVRIDPTAKVAESNESNNIATYKITVVSGPVGQPDLLSTLFSSSKTTYLPGETASLSSVVKNGGSAAAGAFAVEYRLSTNTTITSSDTLLSTVNKTGLSAGASTSASVSVKLPTVAPGTYYLGVRIDPTAKVAESNESNNIATYKITIATACSDKYEPNNAKGTAPNQTVGLNLDVKASPSGTVVATLGGSDSGDWYYWTTTGPLTFDTEPVFSAPTGYKLTYHAECVSTLATSMTANGYLGDGDKCSTFGTKMTCAGDNDFLFTDVNCNLPGGLVSNAIRHYVLVQPLGTNATTCKSYTLKWAF